MEKENCDSSPRLKAGALSQQNGGKLLQVESGGQSIEWFHDIDWAEGQ